MPTWQEVADWLHATADDWDGDKLPDFAEYGGYFARELAAEAEERASMDDGGAQG